MHELGLRIRVEHHRPEVRHFHAHGQVAEFRADGVLHPAIGNQDPERRQVGANRHQEGHQQVLGFAQPIPAKEKQADHGRFQEKGHQSFNRQWRAKDVTHIVRVIRPVGAKLEFERDAGRHTQRKIDAKQLAPKTRHVLPDHVAGHHIDAFHDEQQPHHANGERDKQKVVHRRGGELQPRQVDQFFRNHLDTPGVGIGPFCKN